MSPKAARLAEKQGYTNVKIYNEGMPAWKKGGNQVYVASKDVAGWLDPNHVIVDVRSPSVSNRGHIQGALSFPVQNLEAMYRDYMSRNLKTSQKNLPGLTDKKAPIVVYGEDAMNRDVNMAYAILRNWGYSNAAIMEEGFAAWKAAGRPMASGNQASRAVYEKKLAQGALHPEEFQKLVQSGKAVVLDVRSPQETASGSLSNALTIPLDQLEQRMAQVPRDKPVVIHCRTGGRAEMAYTLLASNGFANVHYLNENIDIGKSGKFCINC